MTRISCAFVALACFTLTGCGGPGSIPAPDESAVKTTTPVEEDLKEAGMEGMTQEEYLQGGKKQ
jgi:predicted small lipoprotein YifL